MITKKFYTMKYTELVSCYTVDIGLYRTIGYISIIIIIKVEKI